MLFNTVAELEKKYKSRMHRLDGYERLMSVRNEERGIYNWFPFFQAFTSNFLERVFKRTEVKSSQFIMDPFSGSGNTLVACREFGKKGYGLDVNPLFRFVAKVKTSDYSDVDFERAEEVLSSATELDLKVDIDSLGLSSFRRLFNSEVLKRLIILRNKALIEENAKAASLLLFALTSELLNFSSAKRYGKGLHISSKCPRKKVERLVLEKLRKMKSEYRDFRNSTTNLGKAEILPFGILEIDKACSLPDAEVVITSPPYCNSSDYVEMYKLELWFLDYVTDRSEFRELSWRTIRSHLSFVDTTTKWSHPAIDEICNEWKEKDLWNPRIPLMVQGYFDDLHSSLAAMRGKLSDDGVVILVIGNSSYGGVVIPSDLLIAEAGKDLGFSVNSIEIARYLLTSPQQQKTMDSRNKKTMRESVVTLTM